MHIANHMQWTVCLNNFHFTRSNWRSAWRKEGTNGIEEDTGKARNIRPLPLPEDPIDVRLWRGIAEKLWCQRIDREFVTQIYEIRENRQTFDIFKKFVNILEWTWIWGAARINYRLALFNINLCGYDVTFGRDISAQFDAPLKLMQISVKFITIRICTHCKNVLTLKTSDCFWPNTDI